MLVKALTHSDSSYFEEYHRRTGMRQKAINLDQAKIRLLFPSMASAANTASYAVRVDVFASAAAPIMDEQTITLSQKNWRLNGLLPGSLVVNPGDVLLCQILGNDAPANHRIPTGVALAVVREGDQGYEWLRAQCPSQGFGTLDDGELLDAVDWDPPSPVRRMVDFLTEGLADIVYDVLAEEAAAIVPRIGLRSVDRTGSTREAVERLTRLRAAIGLGGETLIDAVLERKCSSGEFDSYEWVAASNATAPVDFRALQGSTKLGIEVKTTTGKHDRPFHISTPELREAKAYPPYEIWRVSEFNFDNEELRGTLRRADPARLVESTLQWLKTAPAGVIVPGVELIPKAFTWTDPEQAACPTSRVPSQTWAAEIDLAS